MLVNNWKLILTTTTTFILFNLLESHFTLVSAYRNYNGIIREENNVAPSYYKNLNVRSSEEEPGKLNKNKLLLSNKHSAASSQVKSAVGGSNVAGAGSPSASSTSDSGSSLKSYSNKEVLFGDEDDSEEIQALKASHLSASSSSASASLSSSTSSPAKLDSTKSSIDKNLLEFGPANQNAKISVEKYKTGSNSESTESEKLERKQRTDQKNKHHDLFEDDLRSFHRNKDIQLKHLKQQELSNNFDYDTMIGELLGKNLDIFENELNINKNKLDKPKKVNKFHKPHHNADSNPNNLFNNMNLFDDAEQSNEEFHKTLSNKNNKKVFKPVNNVVNVKENLYIEKDFNNKLKLTSTKEKFMKFLSPLDPFFDNDVINDFDLKMKPEEIYHKQEQSSSINSVPSYKIKDKTNFVDDPNLNAKIEQIKQQNDYLLIFIVAGCTLAGVVAIVAAGVCWYTVHRNNRTASNVEFGVKSGGTAGVFGVNSGSGSIKSKISTNSGDRRLAQSAQMYHYQHQKQQMIAMEKANNDTKPDNSDNSEGETEEGDYTVYECPGLAPTGEMEVKNPLFKEEFSASTNNIFGSTNSSQPPAYSTLTTTTKVVTNNETKPQELENGTNNSNNNQQLIDLDSTSNQTEQVNTNKTDSKQ